MGRLVLALSMLLATVLPVAAQSSFARGTPLQWPAVLTGGFLGFLLLPAAYNIAFFAILRERFLIWDTARVLTLGSLTVSLSSLPIGPWFGADSFARQVLINVLFDLSIALIGPFVRSLLEPGTIHPIAYRLLGWQPLLVASTTPAMLLDACPAAYRAFRDLVLVGILALHCATLGRALWRGSIAARFQTAASGCVMAVYGISLYHDVVLGRPFGLFLYALFTAIALEMLLTSAGIGYRFMRLKRERDQAQAAAAALDTVANADPLTGLPNRRALEREFARQRPYAVCIADIDHFKTINDRFGHDEGDAVIIEVGRALTSDGIFTARLGGEEFAILLYEPAHLPWLEQMRAAIPDHAAAAIHTLRATVTASAGIAVVAEAMTYSTALKAADIQLYVAKNAGRNCAVMDHAVYDGLPAAAAPPGGGPHGRHFVEPAPAGP